MQYTMTRTLWRPGRDAIVRMCATRTNYWTELVLDLVLGTALIDAGVRHHGGSVASAALAVGLGLLAFSFIEYAFHRWLFHAPIPLFEQGHRKHHEEPLGYDSLPFFLPALILLVLAGAFAAVMPTGFALLMAGAITFGYILYGLAHFTIHHVRFKLPLLRRWAGSHHVHHYHPGTNFGVTTPLWDVLLGTRYVRRPGARVQK